MSLTTDQKASQSYKKHKGVSDTSSAKAFFNESILSPVTVFGGDFYAEDELIPNTAPSHLANGESEGVVQRWIDLDLLPVPGSPDAFYHDNMKDAIPFTFGDGSYNYMTTLKDSTGASFPPGFNDFEIDPVAGVLRFYAGAPGSNMPPKISFYKYIGKKGVSAEVIDSSSTIYVETTGNDLTGDGTPGTPYATLERALSDIKNKRIQDGVTITIQIGAGTFDFTAICKSHLESIVFQSKDAQLVIKGDVTTISAVDISLSGSDPFIYDALVSSSPPSWTPNEHQGSIFDRENADKRDTYYPISENTAMTLETFPNLSSGVIHGLDTTLNFDDENLFISINNETVKNTSDKSNLIFELTILQAVGAGLDIEYPLAFYGCSFIGDYVKSLSGSVFAGCVFSCELVADNALVHASHLFLQDDDPTAVLQLNNIEADIRGFIIEATSSNPGVQVKNGVLKNPNDTANTRIGYKIKDANEMFVIGSGKVDTGVDPIIVDNCSYILNKLYGACTLDLQGLGGDTNTSPMTGTVAFLNVLDQLSVNIPGTYPEFEPGVLMTFQDNVTGEVSVGNKLYNQLIEISGVFTRGTDYATYTFKVICDGTTLFMYPVTGDDLADLGITNVDFIFDSVDTDLINLELTVDDSSVNNVTVKVDIKRIMQ